MNKSIFLDINIVIDIIDEARKEHYKSKDMLLKLIEDEYKVYISEDMISTIYYVLKGDIKVLYFFKKFLDEWHIVPFGEDVIKKSLEFTIINGSDLEDTLQCFCAKENKCGLFLTNDKKFIECGIDVVDYDEFLGE